MLVDDNADNRFLAEHSLRKSFGDCSIIVCGSADEAIQKLATSTVDAIVTDHQLGRQSGCEFIAHVRRQGLTCPILLVTCSSDPEVAQAAYRAGATKVFGGSQVNFADFLKNYLATSGETMSSQ